MTHQIHPMRLSRYVLLMAALALAGCDRDQVKVQQVPKDGQTAAMSPGMNSQMPANPHAGMDMTGMGGMGAAQPQVKWTLPAGWKEKPAGDMRAGSFEAGKEGQTADVSIIPLQMPGGAKMELDNYNLWRSSLELPPVDKVESQPVAIGSDQGKLYDVSDSKSPEHILAAVLDKNGVSWYFKMKGQDAVVKEQKQAFVDFLKSISCEASAATAMANPHAGMSMGGAEASPSDAAATSASGGTLPAGWKEIPNPSMLTAKYVIQGSGDAKAEVNVSMLNGTGGGVMANVKRWRENQLGLPPISEEDFSKQAQTVTVGGNQGTLVDMTGTDSKTGKKARLVGIIVPQASDTWFYKLMGDPEIVGQQKDAFIKFLQTAKFGN